MISDKILERARKKHEPNVMAAWHLATILLYHPSTGTAGDNGRPPR